jgi:hypothetical protein
MKLLFFVIAAALSLLNPAQIRASSFITRPLSEVTQRTPTIVRGRIGSSYADWANNTDGSRRIYTFYDLQVSEVFKGDPKANSSIQIRELGGEKDGIGMQVSGAAQFSKGEDVVLMLGEKNPDGSYNVQGLMTGKFAIGHDPSGNETLIGAIDEDAQDHPGPWTISDFRKLVASQSQATHTETPNHIATSPSPAGVAPVSFNSPRAAAVQPSPTASQLQPDRDQGAAQSSDTGFSWGYAVTAILLLGALAIGWMTRKKM